MRGMVLLTGRLRLRAMELLLVIETTLLFSPCFFLDLRRFLLLFLNFFCFFFFDSCTARLTRLVNNFFDLLVVVELKVFGQGNYLSFINLWAAN